MGTVSPIGEAAEAISAVLSAADKQQIVDSIGSGGRLGGYCNNPAFIDRRPYTVALSSLYPNWDKNPLTVFRLGISHNSMPLVLAALTYRRERLSDLLKLLNQQELAQVLRLVWLAMSCPDMRSAFIR
jgi:hypothetical protein